MWLILVFVVYSAGVLTALLVIMRGTHQTRGTLAWVVALFAIPWLALPAYWLSGQVRYDDYATSQAETRSKIGAEISTANQTKESEQTLAAIANFSLLGFQPSENHQLYIDSRDAFASMETAINNASTYVLLQSYLFRDDDAGQRIVAALKNASARGCKVCLLFDELGSFDLKKAFVQDLRRDNIAVHGFSVSRRLLPKIRLNFRNHRKILVVDGTVGFVGGLNIGDEYVDGATMFSAWRDTHLKIAGPAVAGLQATFIEDWRFANKGDKLITIPELLWCQKDADAAETTGVAQRDTKQARIGICALGPHQRLYSGDLLFALMMQSARSRLWIASPYFVPDDRVLASLKAAGLRGVDVRVLVPKSTDHQIFTRVHQEYARELFEYGITMYYYEKGFMHQKVMLIDDRFASIGSANFDNRSFRLNFEVVAVISDRKLTNQVAQMLHSDMDTASRIEADWTSYQSFYDKLITRACRLLSPVL